MTDKEFISDYLQKHNLAQYSDKDITLMLLKLKRFNRWANPLKQDSLRRKVSEVRTAINVRPEKPDIMNDIARLVKEYPEAPILSLAHKLKLTYKQSVYTLVTRIHNYKRYL